MDMNDSRKRTKFRIYGIILCVFLFFLELIVSALIPENLFKIFAVFIIVLIIIFAIVMIKTIKKVKADLANRILSLAAQNKLSLADDFDLIQFYEKHRNETDVKTRSALCQALTVRDLADCESLSLNKSLFFATAKGTDIRIWNTNLGGKVHLSLKIIYWELLTKTKDRVVRLSEITSAKTWRDSNLLSGEINVFIVKINYSRNGTKAQRCISTHEPQIWVDTFKAAGVLVEDCRKKYTLK